MSGEREWAIVSVEFNGTTYNKTSGMPLDWDFELDANELGDRVADERYVGAMLIPEVEFGLSITFREAYIAITLGTKADLTMILKADDGSANVTRTFKNQVFLGQRGGGQKSVPAQNTLRWRYEGDGASLIVES